MHQVQSTEGEHLALYEAILSLKTIPEAAQFFSDLCTPAELQDMTDRWQVLLPLTQEVPYRKIHEMTGVSVTTIGRVARSLKYGTGGYNLILKRVLSKKHGRIKVNSRDPKSGRLNSESLRLLLPYGVTTPVDKQQLFCQNPNLSIDIIFVRDDDIPLLVAEDVCDLGIVGQNVLLERKIECESNVTSRIKKFEIIQYLGFGNCRLSFAAPDDFNFSSLQDLDGCRIATSYPYLVKKFLIEKNVDATIIYLSGSVEIAPRLNIADLICDLVVTGSTLQQNNLRELYSILSSEAILFRSSLLSPEKQQILDTWLQQITTQGVCND